MPLPFQFAIWTLCGGTIALWWVINRHRVFFFKILFIYFLDRGEGREKERERNINVWLPLERPLMRTWLATQTYAPTGNWTGDPLVRRLVLSPLSHTSPGQTESFFWVSLMKALSEPQHTKTKVHPVPSCSLNSWERRVVIICARHSPQH